MAARKLHPLGSKIVLRRVEAEEKTKGGIVLPDKAKERPKEGIVVAVGRGKVLDNGRLVEPVVKVNDRVIFTSYAGTDVKLEGQEYVIMDENDVLAVIESK